MANVYAKNLWMVKNVLSVNPHTMVFQIAKVCFITFLWGSILNVFFFQSVNVTLMDQPHWNVMISMEIVHARRDSLEANVMNANQISLGTSVTHVMMPSLIIQHARVCLTN